MENKITVKDVMAIAGFVCGFCAMGAADMKSLLCMVGIAVLLCAPAVMRKGA